MRPHYHSGHESAKAKSKGFIPSTPTRFGALAKTTASKNRPLRLIWPADTISYGPPYPYTNFVTFNDPHVAKTRS